MIEEDLAVEIGLGEAVGARIEFLAIARRLDAERIELGVEMAAHAVGPDQHQGADRIARRLMDIGRGQSRCPWPAPWRRSWRRRPFRPAPSCRRAPRSGRRAASAASCPGPRTAPRRSFATSAGWSFRLLKNSCHSASTEAGIFLVAGIEIVDVGGVGALQKRGEGKCGVRVLARHDGVLVISARAWKTAQRRSGHRISAIGEPFTLFRANVRAEKNQGLN